MGSGRTVRTARRQTLEGIRIKLTKKRMKFASALSLATCVILSLMPLCQATVSECLTCVATSTQNGAAADACRAGDAANIAKQACVAGFNGGCSVAVQKIRGSTTWTRSCCPENTCMDDVHTNTARAEFDADSCLTDNCNTMDPTSGSGSSNSNSGSTVMFASNLLLLLLFGSTTLFSLIA